MKIVDISESIIRNFQTCIKIPHLYGMRLWLPAGIQPNGIAEYINRFYPYQAHARETGINHLGEELPTLTISVKKTFQAEVLYQNTDSIAQNLMLEYQIVDQEIEALRSVRFWLPQHSCAEKIAGIIDQSSEYQAHAKNDIILSDNQHFPSLVIGSKKIIK